MLELFFAFLGLAWIALWISIARHDQAKSAEKKDNLVEQFYKNAPGFNVPDTYKEGVAGVFQRGLFLAMGIIIGMICLAFWVKSRG